MIELELSKGKVATIDECDAHLAEHKWHFNGRYAVRNLPVVNGKRQMLYLHREIMQPAKGVLVDHINGDRLDNRRCNLRLCSLAQNLRNRKRHVNNKSGFKGIYSQKGKWRVQIGYEGKQIYLGRFDCPRMAAFIYDRAAKMLHGRFAQTNF